MATQRIVGTIAEVFDGMLDGLAARLVRRTKLGYTVELLEAKPPFRQGDTVHLSPAEFRIHEASTRAHPSSHVPTGALPVVDS